jgi:hypothetical protein
MPLPSPGTLFAQQAGALETLAKALKCGGADEKEDTPDAKVNDEPQSITAAPAPAKQTATKAKRKAPEPTQSTKKAPAKKRRQAVKQTPPPPAKTMLKGSHTVTCRICGNAYAHAGAKRRGEEWAATAGHGKGLLTPPATFSAFYPCMCSIEVTHFKADGWYCRGEMCLQKAVARGRAQENGYT